MSRYLFLVDDEKLWKTYNKIWSELNVTIGKKIYKDQVFEKKYMKTKIKSYNNTITEDFNGKAPTDGIKCICLSAIVINSVVKLGKNYYSQTFLEECKYKIKETEKIINLRWSGKFFFWWWRKFWLIYNGILVIFCELFHFIKYSKLIILIKQKRTSDVSKLTQQTWHVSLFNVRLLTFMCDFNGFRGLYHWH